MRLVASVAAVLLLGPLMVVVVNSFNADPLLAGWGGFTWHWFHDVLTDATLGAAALGSLKVAITVTTVSAVLGTLAVGFVDYAPPLLRRMTDSLTISRIMLPEVVVGSSLLVFFPLIHVPYGTSAVVLGHLVWGTAYFIQIAGARRRGSDRRLEDAARDLGAAPWRVLRTVTLPDLLPGLVAGALLTFTFSFDDVVTSLFLAGPSTTTLPLEILSRIHHGISPSINAIGVLVTAATVLVFLTASATGAGAGVVSSRRRRPSRGRP